MNTLTEKLNEKNSLIEVFSAVSILTNKHKDSLKENQKRKRNSYNYIGHNYA